MTPAEVITYALTRDLSTDNIKQSDIDVAAAMYAEGYEETDDYYKNVVAYGVIVNIWERINTEITDRGVVQMMSQGAQNQSWEDKQKSKQEYVRTLEQYIALMTGEDVAEVSIMVESDPGGGTL
jgi:hypothetical protein